MALQTASNGLISLSAELANVVEKVAPSVVRVDDGTRLTATGFIYAAEGVIVTTSHGVERDEELHIERADGTRVPATLVGRDPDTDLAVLRVQETGLPAVQSAGPEEARVGQIVLALGRPGNSGLVATFGIISARIETQSGGQPEYILHTDADFYPGFSGAPVVDVQGRALGIANLMYGRGRGIALGMPTVQNVVETLLAHGSVKRGYLGVRTQLVTLPEAIRQGLEIGQERALLVVQAEPGGPAEQAGLLMGDTLLGIDDRTVQDVDDLRRHLRRQRAGQTVTLHLLRGGERRDLQVTLGAES